MEFITSGWFPPFARRKCVSIGASGGGTSGSRRSGMGASGSGVGDRRGFRERLAHGRSRGNERGGARRELLALPRDDLDALARHLRGGGGGGGGDRGGGGGGGLRRAHRRVGEGLLGVGAAAARGCWPGVPAAPGRAGLARLGVGWSPTPAEPRAGLIGGVASMEGGAWCGRNEEGGGGGGQRATDGVRGEMRARRSRRTVVYSEPSPRLSRGSSLSRVAGGGASPAVSTSSISRARGCEARGRRGRGFQIFRGADQSANQNKA